jgi:hypothetical protein
MSFFDPPERAAQPQQARRQPAWMGPADNVLGGPVGLRILLAKNENVALAINDATAYPNGVELNVALRVRNLSKEVRAAFMHGSPFHGDRFAQDDPADGIPAGLLRLGVQLSDGRKATTLDDRHWAHTDEPSGAVLMQRGGSGGENSWDMRFWLWPLPPPGPIAFVAEWPLGGIPETRVETDAGPILEASKRAQILWPDGAVTAGGGWVAQSIVAQSEPDSRT